MFRRILNSYSTEESSEVSHYAFLVLAVAQWSHAKNLIDALGYGVIYRDGIALITRINGVFYHRSCKSKGDCGCSSPSYNDCDPLPTESCCCGDCNYDPPPPPPEPCSCGDCNYDPPPPPSEPCCCRGCNYDPPSPSSPSKLCSYGGCDYAPPLPPTPFPPSCGMCGK
ncbi:hypothetical protein HNY73_006262 [Argiope bruennichi]|uniref:Uncharacterized protein n=1 Tax=Argiope bruennichi TaxID=94029 RepID=A0A8T0FJG0_ARGBR|nr:hypothetical protein HNY73_006262 [Argiope bruennichi]